MEAALPPGRASGAALQGGGVASSLLSLTSLPCGRCCFVDETMGVPGPRVACGGNISVQGLHPLAVPLSCSPCTHTPGGAPHRAPGHLTHWRFGLRQGQRRSSCRRIPLDLIRPPHHQWSTASTPQRRQPSTPRHGRSRCCARSRTTRTGQQDASPLQALFNDPTARRRHTHTRSQCPRAPGILLPPLPTLSPPPHLHTLSDANAVQRETRARTAGAQQVLCLLLTHPQRARAEKSNQNAAAPKPHQAASTAPPRTANHLSARQRLHPGHCN